MLNQKLRELRKQRGLSQSQMADLLCMSQNAYSNIENGRSGLDEGKVPLICEALLVRPQDLFEAGISLQLNEEEVGNYFGYIEYLQAENKEMLSLLRKQAETLDATLRELVAVRKGED